MPQKSLGGVRVLKLFGISVYLHWSWFIVLVLAVMWGKQHFSGPVWAVYSLVAGLLLFGIVLLHEFGHALACRSVGGKAERIILWPLGGLALVQPPPRPGPTLWSVVAGPLVNVVLLALGIPFVSVFWYGAGDSMELIRLMFAINLGLLVFNLLPVYPLDGGQIVRALLWFVIGRGPSLAVSGWMGIVVAGIAGVVCLFYSEWYLALVAGFGAAQSWAAIQQAAMLRQRANAPRHLNFRCPKCQTSPAAGAFWKCSCDQRFDTFATAGACPACGKRFQLTACPDCGVSSPFSQWAAPLPLPPAIDPAAGDSHEPRIVPASVE